MMENTTKISLICFLIIMMLAITIIIWVLLTAVFNPGLLVRPDIDDAISEHNHSPLDYARERPPVLTRFTESETD